MLLLNAVLPNALALDADTPVFPSLQGVWYKESKVATPGLKALSMAGGAPIVVQGAMMARMPNENKIILQSKNLVGVEIEGPPLSEGDINFSTNTAEGRLGYSTPSVMSLFKTDFENFNGETLPNGVTGSVPYIGFALNILDLEDNWYVNCGSAAANCELRYSRDYTPNLLAVTPSNVYKDQLIQFHVNAKNTQTTAGTPADEWPFREIKLDQTFVQWTNGDFDGGTVTQDQRLPGYARGTLEAIVGNQFPAKNSEPKLMFYPGYAYNLPSSKSCNFVGDDCWTVRSHAKIDSISDNSGYTNGGQSLTIKGWGLRSQNVQVEVDGVPCKVIDSTQNEQLTCVTGKAPADSDTVMNRPGQRGLLRQKLKLDDPTKYLSWANFTEQQLAPVLEKNLMTSFEAFSHVQDTNYGQKLSGWFVAPATANYRFYISCDDQCRLLLDAANPFSSGTPPTPTVIATRYSWTQWRNYFHDINVEGINQNHRSEWISLVQGESYNIEGHHLQYSGGEHFTVSVEIELPSGNIGDHPKQNVQIQQLAIEQINTPEQWSLLVTNADTGSYKLNFLNPTTSPASLAGPYGPISTKASAWDFKNAIAQYYRQNFNCEIQVTLTMYDATLAVTTSAASAKSYSYQVQLLKQITGYSINSISATKIGTNATIAITPPLKGIKSSAPVNGSYQIVCTDPRGKVWTTQDIKYNTGLNWVQNIMTNSIPFLADQVDVLPDYRFKYPENGVSFMLKFTGIKGDVTPCKIQSGNITMLTGNNPTFNNNTILMQANKTLMFEPIPLEFIRANTQTPQVLVKIDDQPALCANLTCDYTYFSDASVISSQSKQSLRLSVVGSAIPFADIQKVSYGLVDCNITTSSDTNIACALADIPVAGEQTVQVTTNKGLIPTDLNFVPTVELLQVNSVTPNTNVNYLGGDILVFQGSAFGTDTQALNVTFDDGTVCDVISVTSTYFSCQTERFSKSAISPLTVRIVVNGVQDVSQTITLLAQAQTSETVTPNRVSPVLKQNLFIQLSSNYSGSVDVSDFSVYLINDNDPQTLKKLYLIKADNTAKSLTVKFPGAPSGNYTLRVVSQIYGRIDTDDLKLTVIGQILDYQPRSGSVYGGTTITITGENFSNDPLDNPVKIGNNYCYVETTNATTITCKTDLLYGEHEGDEDLLVFLKTSEEAACNVDVGCLFTYHLPIATVTQVDATFDATSQKHIATVTGTGLDSSVRLVLDGIEQQLLPGSSGTSASFEVVNIHDTNVTHVEVFTSDGYPEGSTSLPYLLLTPSLLSISPLVGSAGGSKVVVKGTGFGLDTKGLNLFDTKTSKLVCSEVKVVSYGVFTCLTVPGVITDGTGIKLQYGKLNLASSVPSATSYTQVANILISSVVLNGQEISFTGQGFSAPNSVVVASFGGVDADNTVVVSDTLVTATWQSTGVAAISAKPILSFISSSDPNQVSFAQNNAAALSKTLAVDNTATPTVSCSFQGGCQYSIAADGLFAALKDSANKIDVCGNPCVVDPTQSSQRTTVCTLPAISTAYSIENFKTQADGILKGTVFPNTKVLTDGDLTIDYVDPATTGCNFGMTFPTGQVGVITEAKIFINYMTVHTPYANNLALYGSNDNWATSDLLDTFGDNVHEGWNYLDYRDIPHLRPSYNSYKFKGNMKGSCRVTEFKLTGVQTIFDHNSTFTCTPKVMIGSVSTGLTPVTFSADKTPLLTNIWPRFGSVLGGDTVTLTGENFSGTALTTVKFDNRPCSVVSQSTTQIICTTANKPYVPDTPLVEISIDGFGLVATQGLTFRYASLWSEPLTWGNDIPPQEGESISIPKGQHLLVDIDETPEVFAVIVEGSLLFAPSSDPTHHRTFDAHYVMIQGGYMEVGTEEFPYTSHLTITMHGNKYSPSLPIFGNKVIGVHYGRLEMHGVTRDHTWTRLNQTANAGDSQLVLDENVDWQAGEEIVLAGTVFENNQSETRFITQVNGNVVTLDRPLEFTHIGVIPTYGGIEMPMKGEVGLLTRNVLFRGDPETSLVDQYGATIMIHSPGDDSSIARICYCELKDVGQAFKLGRYPIHFHMIGNVVESHVVGNAIHETFNRAITTHAVHYFTVKDNVAYDTMGHTFFIEDAIETNNYYDHNLGIKVKASFSLLNTDVTPGGFWITHPNNIFINNAIANTDAYGFWFDMKEHSIGPSFDVNICGFNDKLGRFARNQAHSVHKYGLRIFHGLIPRTFPCRDIPYDGDYIANGKTDPYWKNPVIPAVFEDSVFWRNGHAGAIMERSGAVQFKNLRCAENGIANMEWSMSENIADGYAKITGGLVVGDTGITDEVSARLRGSLITGVITPRSENFTVEGVTFYNFDWSTAQGLKDCSHCWHPASTDSGARTVTTSNLTFDDATVPKRIRYEIPLRGIWYDLDGSLTGLGPKTWATRDYLHNRQPECTVNLAKYDGLICDSTIQVRRIVFHDYSPSSLDAMILRVAQWEDAQAAAILADNATLYTFQQDVDDTHFSRVQWRQKLAPFRSWPVPFVTGHKYRIHWGWANDFETMQVTPSNRWIPSDKNVHIMTNFTDVRVAINVTTQYGAGVIIANTSYLNKTEDQLVAGDNVIYNQTEVREFNFVINGKDMVNKGQLKLTGIRCWPGQCLAPVIIKPISAFEVYWSDPTAWPSGKCPVEGETVAIDAGVNMVLDINTPVLQMLTIKGRLSFLNNGTAQDLTLNSHIVFVAGGEFIIGNDTNPYNGTATVKLYGISTDQSFAFDNAIQGGNKMLANLGLVSFWGQSRNRNSRLRQPCYWGNTTALVSAGLDWVAGDRVYLAPTAIQYTHSDYVNIKSYDIQTGLLTFDQPLKYYHWGAYESTASDYNGVDMRGEVVLLSRNVRVIGDDTMSWGGQIVTADTMDDLGTLVTGQLLFNNVEVYNCSQENTYQSAIRFEGATTKSHLVQNTVVHEGHGWTFKATMASNILVKDSDFIGAKALGFVVYKVENVTIDGAMIADVTKRKLDLGGGSNFADKEGCVSICAFNGAEVCDVSVINSVAAGCTYAGFVVPGHECGKSATQQVFRNNVAHSSQSSGAVIFPDSSSTQQACYEGSYFAAYKCEHAGIATMFVTQRMNMTQITMIDNAMGISLQTGQEMDINLIAMKNVTIYGETKAQDCPDPSKASLCMCVNKMGFMLAGGNMHEKMPHIISTSSLPMWKIKSYGAWNVITDFQSVTFSTFETNFTDCGAFQNVFAVNHYSSDYIPVQKFTNSKFINVADDAMAYIYDPPEEWNNPDDCIQFPCTAPSNVVITHDKVTYAGTTTPKSTTNSFQIVSDTKSASENLDACTFKEAWNGWSCVNSYLGVLEFQSLDEDQEKRMLSPVYVYNDETGFNNTMNQMMDHTWDGFYTGQLHKAQFPSMIQARGNYTVLYTSTPPKHARYTLRSDRGAIKVKVQYWNAGSYAVKVNGEVIANTPWNKTAGTQAEITGWKGCGENRFVGVKNFLEFWLTAGCEAEVVPIDVIQASVRMQWTLDEFYAQGGVVSFTDRVSAALGIQAYQVKTVAVYQGSVIVQYTVTTAKDETAPTATLAKISTKLNALVSSPSASSVFGAPILNATTNAQTIVGGTAKPTTTTTTAGTTTVVTPAPIIQDTTSTTVTTQKQQVTISSTSQDESKKNQTQVIVIVIAVLVLAIVVAIAAGVFIKNRMRKNINDASTASQAASGQAGPVQNSEMALEPQFDATEFDVDIFTNKKRSAIKKFNDDEVAQKYYDNNGDQFNSNIKLSVTDVNSRIELSDMNKAK